MSGQTITVSGAKETAKALRAVGSNAGQVSAETADEVATFVLGKVRPLIPTRSGNAKSTYRKKSKGRDVLIQSGGSKAPYVPWLEFGGRVGRKKSVKRPYISTGRYLFPTISKHQKDIAAIGDKAAARLVKKAGLDVS